VKVLLKAGADKDAVNDVSHHQIIQVTNSKNISNGSNPRTKLWLQNYCQENFVHILLLLSPLSFTRISFFFSAYTPRTLVFVLFAFVFIFMLEWVYCPHEGLVKRPHVYRKASSGIWRCHRGQRRRCELHLRISWRCRLFYCTTLRSNFEKCQFVLSFKRLHYSTVANTLWSLRWWSHPLALPPYTRAPYSQMTLRVHTGLSPIAFFSPPCW